jgi:glycosyltransferase involved in cell wall biosynthesis
LLIVGDGPCLSEYQKLINEADLLDSVSFVGHQKNVIPYFEKMDVFVLPSLSEGMPLVILESMAMNVPVIATSVGGIPEIVKNNKTGLLVASGSARVLEEAILVLMEDDTLKLTMTANAKAYVEANHVESMMIDAIVALYKE